MEFWWIQPLGFIAFIISVCSYQFKSQKTMYGIRIFNDNIWAIHYYLLDAPIAALSLFISLIRAFLSIFVWPQYKAYFIIVGLVLICGLTFYKTTGIWHEYLPLFSAIIFSLAVYYHDQYKLNRILMFLGATTWLIIGFFNHSYPDMISSSVNMVSIAIAYCRHMKPVTPIKPHN